MTSTEINLRAKSPSEVLGLLISSNKYQFWAGFIVMPSVLISMNYAYGEPCTIFCGSREYWQVFHLLILNVVALVISYRLARRPFSNGLAVGSLVGWVLQSAFIEI